MLSPLAAAAAAARAVAADAVYLTVGTAISAPADARALARWALTVAVGDRGACLVLGCELGPPAVAGGHRVRSCARCGITNWEAARPSETDQADQADAVVVPSAQAEAA